MNEFGEGCKEGFKEFGHTIAAFVNTVLLSIVYFIGVGITAFFARLLNKRFLDMRLKKGSYWEDLNLKKEPIENYHRQF